MRTKVYLGTALFICFAAASGRADFKYTQTSQITGGAMAGMVHAMGIFSKRLREPSQTTTYVKGNFLRTDQANGTYEIIDVDGKRIIQVNPKKHTYSVMTFAEMREAMQKMQARMDEEMKKQSKEKGAELSMTPKYEVNPTGKTQTLLGETTHEVKMKIDMEFQSQSAQQGTQNGSFATAVDSWVAPSVHGYDEVMAIYKKMAVAMDWSPTTVFGADPRVSRSLVELYKSGKIPQGLPMLQVISLEAAGQPGAQGSTGSQPSQASSSSEETPGEAAAKALGGMFGGFGHHKKKKKQQEQTAQSSAPPSLMEITSRVTSYSSDPVDGSLFAMPTGYKLVKSPLQKDLEKNR